jgi:hypothetical protein
MRHRALEALLGDVEVVRALRQRAGGRDQEPLAAREVRERDHGLDLRRHPARRTEEPVERAVEDLLADVGAQRDVEAVGDLDGVVRAAAAVDRGRDEGAHFTAR